MRVKRITVYKADNRSFKDVKKDKGINYQVPIENDNTDDFQAIFEEELHGKSNGMRKV